MGRRAGGSVAVVGGRVLPLDETGGPNRVLEDGTVLVVDGKVAAVGAADDVAVPDGVRVLDAAGCWVLPGFVEPHAHLGVTEDGEGWSGMDSNERTDPVGARMRALDAVNPADLGFRDALSGGVTTAVVKPGSGNVVGGRTVALKCWGRVVDEMVVKEPVSVKSALGENPKRVYGDLKKLPSTRLGIAAVIRDAFARAQDYAGRRDAAAAAGDPFSADPTLEVLARVLSRELPWCQHAHRADDIATALRLADEFGYRLVLNHGTEAHLVADLLVERGVPVVAGPLLTARTKPELRGRTLRMPGLLAAAGVRVALTTDHPIVPVRFLALSATLAVKEGLDRAEALRALTANPAAILGLDERVGSLRTGLDGDVVVWSGDPLDVMSRALHVVVDGHEVWTYDPDEDGGRLADPYGR